MLIRATHMCGLFFVGIIAFAGAALYNQECWKVLYGSVVIAYRPSTAGFVIISV